MLLLRFSWRGSQCHSPFCQLYYAILPTLICYKLDIGLYMALLCDHRRDTFSDVVAHPTDVQNAHRVCYFQKNILEEEFVVM